ncbi:MAG TPA: hypothetical protein VJW77_10600, partial [Terriglobia bacterium]|nr:hypothetical protein [Terriglobia bacterium]
LAGLRSGPGPQENPKPEKPKKQKKQEPPKGDTSNELTKGTFLKSFDNTRYDSLTWPEGAGYRICLGFTDTNLTGSQSFEEDLPT